MSIQGNLKDMALADLIQHNCQDRKTAELRLENGAIYFKNGAVAHAWFNDLEGEEAVYALLRLESGSFALESGVEAPRDTVSRSWSGLLLEGARRIDEAQGADSPEAASPADSISPLLRALAGQLNGYHASMVSAMDGVPLAQHGAPADAISAQLSLLIQLVQTSLGKLRAGQLEDELLTTREMYLLVRTLPGKNYFLGVIVSRKAGNLGKVRLLTRLYADQIAQAI